RGFFGVSRISEIYDTVSAKAPADWEKQFASSSLYQEYVAKRIGAVESGRADTPSPEAGAAAAVVVPPARRHPPVWDQFRILVARYLELIGRDRNGLRLLFLQAPIVAIVILCGFVNKPYEEKILVPRRLEPGERETLVQLAEMQKEFFEQNKALIEK